MIAINERQNTHRLVYLLLSGVLLFIVIIMSSGCTTTSTAAPVNNGAGEEVAASAQQGAYAGKKIMWVDSYDAGYAWSVAIEEGLRSILDDTGVDLKIVRMDTKRNPGDEFAQNAALQAKAEIEAFAPDLVIASDDTAQKFLVVPYLKDTDIPVLFCCVNWDATEYGYPAGNVTGMLEVDLVRQMVDLLKPYAAGESIAYLSGDNATDKKLVPIYNERFFNGEMEAVFVRDFAEFQTEFVRLQDEVDMLYFGNNAGIANWDDAAAEAFILENTKIPTGSRSDWMAPYVLITVAKLGQEQGEWVAQSALQLLDGATVAEIPIAQNKEGQLILNFKLADKLDVVFSPSMMRSADIYGAEEEK